jgi:hypothetical protein
MPRYYFNVCCDSFEATDVVGQSCADEVAALAHAFSEAGDIVRKRLVLNQLPENGWIEVEDERHREVFRLPLRAAAY